MITVLRLGHRKDRDKRASMHVALVARALGADGIVFCGEKDDALLERVNAVSKKWGGKFRATFSASYRTTIKKFPGTKVHLTMYGKPVQGAAPALAGKKLLVVVGSEKVPRDVYALCDCNVAVTNQPHSEIAALALFLREVLGKKAFEKKFPGAQVTILPSEKGKNVKKYK
ncbi:tRNA (cytidine(56)-2'-O)-methyltransferase [Candidatus Micrarchaeota archaeon]|nr:tRNA (cytidine(56)-2'-O)-methyltransferase [Candidatus Micrarchaeota archaeon]